MAKTKAKKAEILQQFIDWLAQSKSVVFTVNKGINAEQMVELRKKLIKNQSRYCVSKKTLINLALKKQKVEIPGDVKFDGPLNTVFSLGDEIIGPKTIYEISKTNDKIEIIGGIFQGKYLDKDNIMQLATMPSKEELYAKLVGSLNAPISGLVNVLAGNLRGLVYALKAIADKKTAA